jgi:polygalacturonase
MTANSVIKDLYIQNYPVHCFSISSCSNLVITNIQINNTAGNAPNAISGGLAAAHNTDGFDISTTTNMVLSDSIVHNQVCQSSEIDLNSRQLRCSEIMCLPKGK